MGVCAWHKAHDSKIELNCLSCLRRSLSLFSNLEDEELALLTKNKTSHLFAKDEPIFRQGMKPSGIYALSGGKVKNVRMNDTGSQQIIGLHKPVEFIGFYDFISDHDHTFSAVALESSSVCHIPAEDFLTVIKRNNELAMKTLRFVSQEFALHVERMSNLTAKHMRGRMADTLLYIYDLFEVANQDSVLDIELKRRDFAGLANMNTANAIRTLSEFSKDGLIDIQKTHIRFLDTTSLRHISMMG